MTLTLKSCFVTLAILFLWQVEEGAEACTCMQGDPQQAICNSDVVNNKMFKGPWGIGAVYTSGPCRAYMDNGIGREYLLTGRQDANGVVHISMCNFIKPWYDLSATELSLIQNHGDNCG